MKDLIDALLAGGLAREQLLEHEPMDRHTTMRVGGTADLVVLCASDAQIVLALKTARSLGVPAMVIGAGSNLIVRDGGFRGMIVLLGDNFSQITVKGESIIAEAGAKLSCVGSAALRASLMGFEFACGIPGSVGGGTAMNAGAYGGELKDCLAWADVLDGEKILRLTRDELELSYRNSRVLREHLIVLRSCFALHKGDPAGIQERMNELAARRREKQPLSFPSSGSTFKRPEGYYAGALIEQAGLKGARVGGAQVSEKHAGFVINAGGATAADVLRLIAHVQETVCARSGVRLECEVRIIGED